MCYEVSLKPDGVGSEWGEWVVIPLQQSQKASSTYRFPTQRIEGSTIVAFAATEVNWPRLGEGGDGAEEPEMRTQKNRIRGSDGSVTECWEVGMHTFSLETALYILCYYTSIGGGMAAPSIRNVNHGGLVTISCRSP